MNKEEFRQKLLELRTKIAYLSPNDKANPNHPLYAEIRKFKREYALNVIKEKEMEENKNDKYQGK